MGYQLWTSPVTGYRRIGTRFSDVRSLFDTGITAVSIFEPLKSCPADATAIEMKELLLKRDFDVAGVMETKDGPVVGYVLRSDLESGNVSEHKKKIEPELLISDSAPIPDLFSLLRNQSYLFVLNKTKIEGIVTRADLNKPPVRIYLFGIVSLLEMHLGFWVKKHYQNESWKNHISKRRLIAAKKLYKDRKRRNQDIGLFECLQIADKRDLFLKIEELRNTFSISSKRTGKEILKQAEDLRNSLAHSQIDISIGLGWDNLFKTIVWIELFITRSDSEIERQAQTQSNEYDEELWQTA